MKKLIPLALLALLTGCTSVADVIGVTDVEAIRAEAHIGAAQAQANGVIGAAQANAAASIERATVWAEMWADVLPLLTVLLLLCLMTTAAIVLMRRVRVLNQPPPQIIERHVHVTLTLPGNDGGQRTITMQPDRLTLPRKARNEIEVYHDQ